MSPIQKNLVASGDSAKPMAAISEPKNLFWRWLFRLAAAVTIFAAVYTIYSTKEARKQLQVDFESVDGLLDQNADASYQLSIFAGGVELKQPYAVVATVRSIGTVAITPDDIEKYLNFHFKSAKVAVASVQSRSDSSLDVSVANTKSDVTIKHGLLNPGDSFRLAIIADGEEEVPEVAARIAGVGSVGVAYPGVESSIENFPFYFDLTTPVEWALVVIVAITVVALLVMIVRQAIVDLRPKVSRIKDEVYRLAVPEDLLSKHVDGIFTADQAGLVKAIVTPPLIEWFDKPELLYVALLDVFPDADAEGLRSGVNQLITAGRMNYKNAVVEKVRAHERASKDAALPGVVHSMIFSHDADGGAEDFAFEVFDKIANSMLRKKYGRPAISEAFGTIFAVAIFLAPLLGIIFMLSSVMRQLLS